MNVGQNQRPVRGRGGVRCGGLPRGGRGLARVSAKRRGGTAAVEAAVSLPLLIVLVFGAIEVASGVFLSQTLAIAAYEGAREAADVPPGRAASRAPS